MFRHHKITIITFKITFSQSCPPNLYRYHFSQYFIVMNNVTLQVIYHLFQSSTMKCVEVCGNMLGMKYYSFTLSFLCVFVNSPSWMCSRVSRKCWIGLDPDSIEAIKRLNPIIAAFSYVFICTCTCIVICCYRNLSMTVYVKIFSTDNVAKGFRQQPLRHPCDLIQRGGECTRVSTEDLILSYFFLLLLYHILLYFSAEVIHKV